MRKLSIFIVINFLWTISFSQTDGYKDIKLGEKFTLTAFSDSYIISQIAEKVFRLKSISEQKFCAIPIACIDIKLKSDSSIELEQLYTIDKTFKNHDDFFNDYMKLGQCIINTVGNASYYNLGNDKADGQITTAWIFDNKKYYLALYGNDLSIFDKNVVRHFLVVWSLGNGTVKMW